MSTFTFTVDTQLAGEEHNLATKANPKPYQQDLLNKDTAHTIGKAKD